MNRLRNFYWQREDEPQNLLTYVFLLVNLVYGITFTFLSHTKTVQASAFAMHALPVEVWGAACLVLFVATLISSLYRPRLIGQGIGMAGFLVWSYGFYLYFASGVIFAALAIYLPQMLFWGFWYIGVRRYYAKESKV